MTSPLIVTTAAELRKLVRAECEAAVVSALRKPAVKSNEHISAGQAAKAAHVRDTRVLAACASGALPAIRRGNRWSIRVSDLDAWASHGAPTTPTT